MSNQVDWSNVNYIDLPHTFYGRGIASPCGRFYVSTRSEGSRPYSLNWGVLDLHTHQFIDGFRFRRDAVANVQQLTASLGLSYTAKSKG
jgi:hypothetical protein